MTWWAHKLKAPFTQTDRQQSDCKHTLIIISLLSVKHILVLLLNDKLIRSILISARLFSLRLHSICFGAKFQIVTLDATTTTTLFEPICMRATSGSRVKRHLLADKRESETRKGNNKLSLRQTQTLLLFFSLLSTHKHTKRNFSCSLKCTRDAQTSERKNANTKRHNHRRARTHNSTPI